MENTTGAVFALGGRLKSRDQVKSSNAPVLLDDNTRKNRHVFNIEILEKNGDNSDRTRVVINESASLDYEISCDAAKFMSDNKDVAHIYTVDNENNHLAINERPLSDGYVDLEIVTGNSAEYVIRATRTDGEIILIDNTDGSSTDLTSEEYILYAQPNNTISGRYRLMFKPVNRLWKTSLPPASKPLRARAT